MLRCFLASNRDLCRTRQFDDDVLRATPRIIGGAFGIVPHLVNRDAEVLRYLLTSLEKTDVLLVFVVARRNDLVPIIVNNSHISYTYTVRYLFKPIQQQYRRRFLILACCITS